jgi:hypothetical protein
MDKFIERHQTAIIVGATALAVTAAAVYLISTSSAADADDTVSHDDVSKLPADAQPAPAAASREASRSSSPRRTKAAAEASTLSTSSPGAPPNIEGEVLPRELYLKILQEMARKLNEVNDEFLRKQAEGEEIDAEQQQLEVASALMKLEHDMQEKYNVTSASVFLSQQAYADDEEVRMENERVREIFGIPDQHDLSSEPLPEGMTADLFYDLFCTHVDQITKGVEECFETAKRQAPLGQRTAYADLLLQQNLQLIHERAVTAVGLTDESFQLCLMHFHQDPRFMQKMISGQMHQQQLRSQLDA